MSFEPNDETPPRAERSFSEIEPIEYLLFDSLVHHLIEKGVLTKNDALSVVETVAQVVRVYVHDDTTVGEASAALATLKRTYSSFEAIPKRSTSVLSDFENVRQLRPPLHGEHPEFPAED